MGQCESCERLYELPEGLMLGDARCPYCFRPLGPDTGDYLKISDGLPPRHWASNHLNPLGAS